MTEERARYYAKALANATMWSAARYISTWPGERVTPRLS